MDWQGVSRPRAGLDAVLTVIEQLQGAPLPASVLETRDPSRAHRRIQAGRTWTSCAPPGRSCGGESSRSGPPMAASRSISPNRRRCSPRPREKPQASWPERSGSCSSDARRPLLCRARRRDRRVPGRPRSHALWDLVWAGEVTNDTLAPLRALHVGKAAGLPPADGARTVASARAVPARRAARDAGPCAAPRGAGSAPSETERRAALAPQQLLERYGVLTREAVHAEGIAGGFSAVYEVLKALEDAGRVRRGLLRRGSRRDAVRPAGGGRSAARAARALGRAGDARAGRDRPGQPLRRGPPLDGDGGARPQRAAGAQVVLRDGALIAYAGRTERNLITFLPSEEPERGTRPERSRIADRAGRIGPPAGPARREGGRTGPGELAAGPLPARSRLPARKPRIPETPGPGAA